MSYACAEESLLLFNTDNHNTTVRENHRDSLTHVKRDRR